VLHVGLDLSRRRVDVCLISSEGELVEHFRAPADRPSLSTSGETLTIEVSMNLEGENGERRNVGDEQEWSWAGG
jgi:hypothetical protein